VIGQHARGGEAAASSAGLQVPARCSIPGADRYSSEYGCHAVALTRPAEHMPGIAASTSFVLALRFSGPRHTRSPDAEHCMYGPNSCAERAVSAPRGEGVPLRRVNGCRGLPAAHRAVHDRPLLGDAQESGSSCPLSAWAVSRIGKWKGLIEASARKSPPGLSAQRSS
jgi:hypothetical protein